MGDAVSVGRPSVPGWLIKEGDEGRVARHTEPPCLPATNPAARRPAPMTAWWFHEG